jgi:hypothetical protein
MALFGTLVMRATHRLMLRGNSAIEEAYVCAAHAEQLARRPGLWMWEALDSKGTA